MLYVFLNAFFIVPYIKELTGYSTPYILNLSEMYNPILLLKIDATAKRKIQVYFVLPSY